MIILRDMIESDIEDYVTWFTAETEWANWDAPWEPLDCDETTERAAWTEYYHSVKTLADHIVRWKFEIEENGVHIGWISAYTDLGYIENPEKIPAIGLDIPNPNVRGRGCGTDALKQFIAYLRKHGHRSFYTQTWSGNHPMIRVAEKFGFKEVFRKKNARWVNGKQYDAITYRIDL